MPNQHSNPSFSIRRFVACGDHVLPLVVGCVVALTSCSSGGGGDGAVAGGGIGGTGAPVALARGEVNAFGSIFVNGIEWETTDTEIFVSGAATSESELDLGMIVLVKGELDDNNAGGTASLVRYEPTLRGPISTIAPIGNDGVEKALTILGQSVLVESGQTLFRDVQFDTLTVDDVVEVSGLVDSTRTIRATRVRQEGVVDLGTTEVKLRGTVSDFNGISQFRLGSIMINVTNSTELSELPGGIQNGQFVDVEGTLTDADQLQATEIELEDRTLDDTNDASLQGVIGDFNGLSDFEIDGQTVDAGSAILEPNDPALFGEGVSIQVEGAVVNGVLLASELELRNDDAQIEAEVAPGATDVGNSTLQVLGVTIEVNASTLFEDARDDLPNFGLGDISTGDFLSVRGTEIDNNRITATQIERKNATVDVVLQGFVDSVETNSLTILGVTVGTDGNTKFETEDDEDIDSDAFFLQLQPGNLVKVKREANDGDATAIDLADEVEFED